MALNDVTFVKGQGGLGRPLAGEDHISGFVFYVADTDLPTPDAGVTGGFTSTNRIKALFSTADAEKFGLKKTSTTKIQQVMWYHISEYFRLQPKGVLFVGMFTPQTDYTTHTYAELASIQNFSGGTIRQAAVYLTASYDKLMVGKVHAAAKSLSDEHKPLSVLLAASLATSVDLSTLDTLAALDSPYVSVVIGEDGAGFGKSLSHSTDFAFSVTCLGAALGAVSRAKVSENIGWVKNFNLAETELDVAAFANGKLYRDQPVTLLDSLNDKHFIFLRKHIGLNGTYFNDSFTAAAATSDYCTIENNRTIDKAIRNIRTFIIPELNGPLYVDDSGKLSEDTIAYFKSLTSRPLEQMQRDGELSAFGVTIDPTQPVLSLSKLVIAVSLVPVGVAREIQINIGFTVKIS